MAASPKTRHARGGPVRLASGTLENGTDLHHPLDPNGQLPKLQLSALAPLDSVQDLLAAFLQAVDLLEECPSGYPLTGFHSEQPHHHQLDSVYHFAFHLADQSLCQEFPSAYRYLEVLCHHPHLHSSAFHSHPLHQSGFQSGFPIHHLHQLSSQSVYQPKTMEIAVLQEEEPLVLPEPQEYQDLQEKMATQEAQVPQEDLQDRGNHLQILDLLARHVLQQPQDVQDPQDDQDNPANQDPQVAQHQISSLDHQGHLDLPDPQETQESQGRKDHPGALVLFAQVLLHQDPLENLVHVDLQDPQVAQVSQEPIPEEWDNQESLEIQVGQEPQDSQEVPEGRDNAVSLVPQEAVVIAHLQGWMLAIKLIGCVIIKERQ